MRRLALTSGDDPTVRYCDARLASGERDERAAYLAASHEERMREWGDAPLEGVG